MCDGVPQPGGRTRGRGRSLPNTRYITRTNGSNYTKRLQLYLNILRRRSNPTKLFYQMGANRPIIFRLFTIPRLTNLNNTNLSNNDPLKKNNLPTHSLYRSTHRRLLRLFHHLLQGRPSKQTVYRQHRLFTHHLIRNALRRGQNIVSTTHHGNIRRPNRLWKHHRGLPLSRTRINGLSLIFRHLYFKRGTEDQPRTTYGILSLPRTRHYHRLPSALQPRFPPRLSGMTITTLFRDTIRPRRTIERTSNATMSLTIRNIMTKALPNRIPFSYFRHHYNRRQLRSQTRHVNQGDTIRGQTIQNHRALTRVNHVGIQRTRTNPRLTTARVYGGSAPNNRTLHHRPFYNPLSTTKRNRPRALQNEIYFFWGQLATPPRPSLHNSHAIRNIPLTNMGSVIRHDLGTHYTITLTIRVTSRLFYRQNDNMPPKGNVTPRTRPTCVLHRIRRGKLKDVPLPMGPNLPINIHVKMRPHMTILAQRTRNRPTLKSTHRQRATTIMGISPHHERTRSHFTLHHHPRNMIHIQTRPMWPTSRHHGPRRRHPMRHGRSPTQRGGPPFPTQ